MAYSAKVAPAASRSRTGQPPAKRNAMTYAILMLLILAALLLGVLRRRRSSAVLGLLAVVTLFAVGCGPVPAWLLEHLQAGYAARAPIAWGQRNAIVVLGAGVIRPTVEGEAEPGVFSYPRVVAALRLYRECSATGAQCRVLLSGGDARKIGTPEADVYRAMLLQLGVPPADIVTEPQSMNTWQNASLTAALLDSYRPDRVVLVSSAIHLRRSQLYFSHFGIRTIGVRADYLHAHPSIEPRAYNFTVADFALHEYLGIARYALYNAMGWNAPRRQAGDA